MEFVWNYGIALHLQSPAKECESWSGVQRMFGVGCQSPSRVKREIMKSCCLVLCQNLSGTWRAATNGGNGGSHKNMFHIYAAKNAKQDSSGGITRQAQTEGCSTKQLAYSLLKWQGRKSQRKTKEMLKTGKERDVIELLCHSELGIFAVKDRWEHWWNLIMRFSN